MNILKFFNAGKTQQSVTVGVPGPGPGTVFAAGTEQHLGTLAREEREGMAAGKAADRATFGTPKPPEAAKPTTLATPELDVKFPPRIFVTPDQEIKDEWLRMLAQFSPEPLVTDKELSDLTRLHEREAAANQGKEKCSMAAISAEYHRLWNEHEQAIKSGGTPGPFWDHAAYEKQKEKAVLERKVYYGESRSIAILREEILKNIRQRLIAAAWIAADRELAAEQEAAARWGIRHEPSLHLRVLVWFCRKGCSMYLHSLNRPPSELAKLLR